MVRSEPQASVSNHAGPHSPCRHKRNRSENPESRESRFRIFGKFHANRASEPGGARNDPEAAIGRKRRSAARRRERARTAASLVEQGGAAVGTGRRGRHPYSMAPWRGGWTKPRRSPRADVPRRGGMSRFVPGVSVSRVPLFGRVSLPASRGRGTLRSPEGEAGWRGEGSPQIGDVISCPLGHDFMSPQQRPTGGGTV